MKQHRLTDGQEQRNLDVVICCRSDGCQKIKNEMPDLICVTFTVTLHCVSLSKCHKAITIKYHTSLSNPCLALIVIKNIVKLT